MILSQMSRWKGLTPDADTTPEEPATLAARRCESVKDARAIDKGLAATASTARRHSLEPISSHRKGLSLLARIPTASPTPDELHEGGAFSFARYLAKTSESERAYTTRSAPGLSGKPDSARFIPEQQLKKSHYFHSEMQFMMALVEISDRLRTVPKEARQSTLIAELSLINHNLPASVCLPAWCGASAEHPTHHRIARISPSDAVVLNSADRVPYLITVEVLEDVHPINDMLSPLDRMNSPLPERPITPNGSAVSDVNGDMLADVGEGDYHRQVLHRRKSAASMKAKRSIDGGSPVIEQHLLPTPVSAAKAGPVVVDEFSERLRTAAVMLAQLYQQQQRELSAQSRGELDGPSNAGGLGSATPAGSAISVAPGSPLPTSKSRTNAQKLQADFESIKKRLVSEMVMLEEKQVQSLARQGDAAAADEILPESEEQLQAQCQQRDADDPSAAVFRETWDAKMERIRAGSPFGRDPTWRLLSVIVKSGADLRQEQLALQLINEMQRIWRSSNVPVWVCCFRILITSDQSGIMETVRDAISIHSIKKEGYAKHQNERGLPFTLYDYFVKEFGNPSSTRFHAAQDNFMRSLAAYSIICYLLQIKDRHNGNILIDIQGHVIHIDFGFMLSNTPGGAGFELAPFKMPQEYIDILGGRESKKFAEFRALAKESFLVLRKRAEEIVGLVEMMEHGSRMSCFTGVTAKPTNGPATGSNPTASSSFMNFMGAEHADAGGVNSSSGGAGASTLPVKTTTTPSATAGRYPVAAALRERFHLALNETQVGDLVDSLIDRSCGSAYTRFYDTFQYYANGIL
ncbi:Phosphatidylinositol 4-kinase pik1alpha (PI4-kinase)(PtdIns-4-kinase) [Geranomyces michiganensis]|nr:Phosphatidylinositol 4-kinase pik1alpha (PI4-kinase)(PtdIns-4-kinase) [Geranomyces michiganensis]